MARLIAELEKGTYIEPSKLTFGDYLRDWLKAREGDNLSPTTLQRYSQIIELRAIPKLGMLPLEKLRPVHLQKFMREVAEEGRLDGKEGPLSHDSIRYHYRVLHKALEDAVKMQLLPYNPANAVTVPKPPQELDGEDAKEEVQVLTAEEVEVMLETAKDTSYYHLLFVAVRTGPRRGELLALR